MARFVLAVSPLLLLPITNPSAVRIYTWQKGLEADHLLKLLKPAILRPAVLECLEEII
jgi:hypothetical protein